jgi:glycosyltransferase involved in cell wall biosynthesis
MLTCPVSVIIPTYNRAAFLQRSIKSVDKQSLPCAEIIVVDDGSTDNSSEVLDTIKEISRTPIVTIRTENRGVAAARNLGVKKARYNIISFLDSDDHWNRKKNEKQYSTFKNQSTYQICHTREKWLRRGEHLNQKLKHIPRQGDIFSHCLELCGVGMSTVMMEKELFEKVGGFDESMRCCEDYDLWLRVSSKHEFLLIEESLIVKEGGRKDQLSSIYRLGMDERRIYSIQKLLDSEELSARQYKLAMLEFERKINIFAHGCLKHGKKDMGNTYLELLSLYQNKQQNVYNLNDNE